MTFLDFLVIAAYGVAMLAVGCYYAMRTNTADDYLLGGRSMNPIMIGLSLFATIFSTLSYLALPGEMIKNGPMIFAQLTALPAVALVVGWVLIPWIMRQRVTSGYELLESRLGIQGRLLGAGMFVALRTIWMASIFYATSSKVLVPMLELDPAWTPALSAAMGVVTLIYTSVGGMRAVVVTDAMQSIIMFVGAMAIIGVITVKLGGVGAWWPKQWVTHWKEPVFWFSASERVTFMGAFLNMFVWTTCTAGSDQMAIQRYLSTRDVKAARRSFNIHLVADVVIAVLLGLVGLTVLAYFAASPDLLPEGKSLLGSADELLSLFIVNGLPAGLTGLVIAAILSAAMSSLSSGMNASAAVITNDFIGRFRSQAPSPTHQVWLARWVSIAVGVMALVLSNVVPMLADNLLEICMKVVNLLTAPLFVLFFLALFVPWAKPVGAIAATVVSVGVAVTIAFFKDLHGIAFLWMEPAALAFGVIAGMLASLPMKRAAIDRPESQP